MLYRIVDLDNCISDDGWRIPKIDWQHEDLNRRYHSYHSLAPFDLLANGQIVSVPQSIIVCTARPVMFRAATMEWLARNCVHAALLLMRNDGEHEPSAALKAKQLSWIINYHGIGKESIERAFDDREDVVEMYRAHGISAEVARVHDLPHDRPLGLRAAGVLS